MLARGNPAPRSPRPFPTRAVFQTAPPGLFRLPAPSPVATVAARAFLPMRGRFCLLPSSCAGLCAMQIKAEAVAKILGGRRVSGGFLCHCPVATHGKGRGDVHPSLTVADGDRALLYTCHAGCDPRAIRAAIDRLDLRGEPLYASGAKFIFRARNAKDHQRARPRPLARRAGRRRHSRRNLSSRARLRRAAARHDPVFASLSL